MSRLLFVVQEDTSRSFPIPPPPNEDIRRKLFRGLIDLSKKRGEVTLSPECLKWYTDWYNGRKESSAERQFAGYSERKPDHVIRLGLILAASTGDPASLSPKHLQSALRILDWLETLLPGTFEQMGQSMIGEDHGRMLKQIKSRGGTIEHSTWLRLNSNRMDARIFRERIDTMRQAKLIDFDQTARSYILTPEGWK
jgi:hypothetical protein